MSECDPSDGDDDSRWTAPATDVELTVGSVPDAIDRSWGRASYPPGRTTTRASHERAVAIRNPNRWNERGRGDNLV